MKRLIIFLCVLFLTSCAQKVSDEEAYVRAIPQGGQQERKMTNHQFLVVLDAGHGGKDSGAKKEAVDEKNLSLLTTLLTKKFLEGKGYRVQLTRRGDHFLSLQHRVALANKSKAHLFVSIHYNACETGDAQGIEVYYCKQKDQQLSTASRRLAQSVLSTVINSTRARSRGVKNGNFLVIRDTNMPAILVEGGFMTNKQEFGALKNRSYLSKIAHGIAEGIDRYIQAK